MESSKNTLFIVFWFFFLAGIFIQNLLENSALSFGVLSLVIILFLNFYFFRKIFLLKMIFAVIGIIIWIFISQVSTSEYLEKDLKIIPYSQIKSEITFEIKDIYKILNYTWEYIVELNSINWKTLIAKQL